MQDNWNKTAEQCLDELQDSRFEREAKLSKIEVEIKELQTELKVIRTEANLDEDLEQDEYVLREIRRD